MKLKSKETAKELNLKHFSKFVEDNQRRLTFFAQSYVLDTTIAEDIVMESMMAVWNYREKLDTLSAMPYAVTSVKNKSFNHLRNKKTRLQANNIIQSREMRILDLRISTLEDTVPKELCRTETEDILSKAVNSLPDKTRKIFILNKYEEKKYREIADEFGITVKSVEYELFRAMKILRRRLKGLHY